MDTTILALGSSGDIQPYARLGLGLHLAGHQVRFITSATYAPILAGLGLDFAPLPGDAQALIANAGADMWSIVRAFRKHAREFARSLSALVPMLKNTDVLLNQLPLALYGYDLAQKLSTKMIVVAVMPLTRTSAFPVMGFPHLPLPFYNKITYYLAEQAGWQLFRSVIQDWRVGELGLPRGSFLGYFDQLATKSIPMIYGFSPQVVPPPADWGESVHVTGYWFPEDGDWKPPPDLLAFIETSPPPLFIGFGSMPVADAGSTTQLILEAVKRTNQRCVLHTGWAGIGDQPLPDYIYKIQYAPYGWLFPRMAMVIHHGGSGTTAFGLRAGVPSLAVPMLFDQFFWGERITALGVGPPPIPFRKLTAERLAQAIEFAISDKQMRQRAAELGKKIQAENGTDKAIKIIQDTVYP